MPTFFNGFPLGNQKLPKFHESSPMRSPRDQDATGRQHLRNAKQSAQEGANFNSIAQLRRELGKLRRRIVGGGATSAAPGSYIAGQWSPTASYPDTTRGAQAIVFFTGDSGVAGTFYTLKAVPIGTAPDTGFPYWAGFPNQTPSNWG